MALQAQAFNRSHARYLRRDLFKKLRHGRQFLSFLSTQAARLTAAGKTLTTITQNAQGVLTAAGIPANADTVVLAGKTYTLQTVLTNVDGNVLIGASAATALANLQAAINLGAGAGTTYAAATTANPSANAQLLTATTLTAVANAAGVAGNALGSTKTSANLSWAAATLLGGVAISTNVTVTAHGYTDLEGPFVITTPGVLALPFIAGGLFWVHKVDANTLQFFPSRDGAARSQGLLTFTTGGAGVHTITRALTQEGVFDLLKTQQNRPETLVKTASADSLK